MTPAAKSQECQNSRPSVVEVCEEINILFDKVMRHKQFIQSLVQATDETGDKTLLTSEMKRLLFLADSDIKERFTNLKSQLAVVDNKVKTESKQLGAALIGPEDTALLGIAELRLSSISEAMEECDKIYTP